MCSSPSECVWRDVFQSFGCVLRNVFQYPLSVSDEMCSSTLWVCVTRCVPVPLSLCDEMSSSPLGVCDEMCSSPSECVWPDEFQRVLWECVMRCVKVLWECVPRCVPDPINEMSSYLEVWCDMFQSWTECNVKYSSPAPSKMWCVPILNWMRYDVPILNWVYDLIWCTSCISWSHKLTVLQWTL